MPILHTIANKLTKHPQIKYWLKNMYQHIGNILSDNKTVPSNIKQISGNCSEHLFGYYDKSPWDTAGDRMIYLRITGASRYAASNRPADIILKTISTDKETVIAQTCAWNVQQGCMLQWLGPEFNDRVIYNDFRDGKYCSVILTISSREEKILPLPVYSVSESGTYALTLDFSRLNSFRPGYGYINLPDPTVDEMCPNSTCIWRLNLTNQEIKPLFTYKDLFEINTRSDMVSAYHKVNHIMINPSSDRFMFLHRWILNGVKYDRLITADLNGKDLYVLLDDNMVSHCNWKNNDTIITWANTHKFGTHYYLLTDKSDKKHTFEVNELKVDGHPSYSPDGKFLITDTYPDYRRKQSLILCNPETREAACIAHVYASITYNNATWCRKGQLIANVLSSPFGVGNSKFRYSQKPQYVDTVAFGLYKKDLFSKVGYFDESLARNQDNDMHRRIRDIGGKFYLNPEIKTIYHPRETIKGMMRQGFNNGKWNIITFSRDPKTLSARHLVPLFFVMGILNCLILGAFNYFFWSLLLAVIIMHMFIGIVFAAKKTRRLGKILSMSILFMLLHLSYGVGSLISILNYRKRSKGDFI